MTDSTGTPPATPPSNARTSRRRSRDDESAIKRGKAALKKLDETLDQFIHLDADLKEARVGKPHRDLLASVLKLAQRAIDGQSVFIHEVRAQTTDERATATALAKEIKFVIGRVRTHKAGTKDFRKLMGVGTNVDARRTGPLILLAGNIAEGSASAAFAQMAQDAGVTSRVPGLRTLADKLSVADIGQHGKLKAQRDGTLTKKALVDVLNSLVVYTQDVAGNLFGKDSAIYLALANPAPLVEVKHRQSNGKKPKRRSNGAGAKALQSRKQKVLREASASTKKGTKPKRGTKKTAKKGRAKR